MRAFLNELTDPQLLQAISYESALTNNRYAIPLWHMMSDVVNHGTQHRRGGASPYPTRTLSPGDLDLIVYLNPLPI